MSGQHQRDNGYSTSNHDGHHACVPVVQRLLLQSRLMLLFPVLLLLLLLQRLLSLFLMFLLLMLLLSVLLVQPMLLLCFLTMAIDRGPWPTACPNATATALLHVACQLGSKVHGALL